MILRHITDENGKNANPNSFEAYDADEKRVVGSCVVYPTENQTLFPNRPVRVFLEISGESVPDAVLGAAVARARQLATGSGKPARIFTQLEPEDKSLMPMLSIVGFQDNDGLVLMRRRVEAVPTADLPSGTVVVEDTLEDPLEQKYFLDRYNLLFREEKDAEWLQLLRASEGFRRLLIVSPMGMLGEIVFRVNEEGVAELLWLHTALKWRRKGIATRLLGLCLNKLEQSGVETVETGVQAKIPNIIHALERSGFKQTKLLCRYPGIDIEPPKTADK